MLLLIPAAILLLLYAGLIHWYWVSWKKLGDFQRTGEGNLKISVVIAARNEENSIGILLGSLDAQTYPKNLTEIIVVDDSSTDDTTGVVRQFRDVRLLSPRNTSDKAFKKNAILTGINGAGGELIVTTDADCIVPPHWLEMISDFFLQKKAVAVAGPVLLSPAQNFIERFQCMDFITLQGITGATLQNGSMILANGANLAYLKSAFEEVGGFSGIDHVDSGDDMMLLYKIARAYPGRVHYLRSREAIVATAPMPSWKTFINQRLRWAGKSFQYDDKRILPVLVLVYLANLVFPLLLISAIFNPVYWVYLLSAWIFKTIAELPFYLGVSAFFNRKSTAKWLFLFQPVHIAYTLYVGVASQFRSHEWKGRRTK